MACFKAGGNGISVYETETFNLLEKKHVTLEGICLFQWSPTRPILAYYCEERVCFYLLPYVYTVYLFSNAVFISHIALFELLQGINCTHRCVLLRLLTTPRQKLGFWNFQKRRSLEHRGYFQFQRRIFFGIKTEID